MIEYYHVILPHLQMLFNKILDSGKYPANWCEAILCQLHKKGPTNNVDNFRGISLLSVVSKIFTKVINQRFVKWANETIKEHEEQAGYRKNYSTVDQIFNLQSLVQNIYVRQRADVMFCSSISQRLLTVFHMHYCGTN